MATRFFEFQNRSFTMLVRLSRNVQLMEYGNYKDKVFVVLGWQQEPNWTYSLAQFRWQDGLERHKFWFGESFRDKNMIA